MSGRGQVNLDLSNPYLAPNKFISEEAKASETLKGFLSLKGAPDSIEFSDPLIGSATLKLYYQLKNEHYKLEERGKEWIITGPESIFEDKEKPDSNAQKSIFDPGNNSPALLPLKENTNDPVTPTLPQDDSTTKTDVEPTTKNSNTEFKDAYHEVTFAGQTLTFIANWYTGNNQNSDRLKRINSSLSENLKFGDIVRIPSYLIIKEDSPTEKDLQKFTLEYSK